MKGKVAAIGTILVIIFIVLLMGKSYQQGGSMNSVTNPMTSYSSLAELQKSVNFKFRVPSIVAKAENIEMFNYSGSMIEIKSDRINFRAARFIDAKADVSGDYNEYATDIWYKSKEAEPEGVNTLVRYRTDGKNTLVNISDGSIAYSVKINEFMSEADALSALSIDITKLTTFDSSELDSKETNTESSDDSVKDEIKNTESETNDTVDKNSGSNNEEVSTEDEQLTFRVFKNDDLGISFMLPNTPNELKGVYSNNQLAMMLEDKVVFVVEYYEDGYSNTEFNGYQVVRLNDSYVIRYIVNNTFDKNSQLYKDYNTVTENISTLASTFQYK